MNEKRLNELKNQYYLKGMAKSVNEDTYTDEGAVSAIDAIREINLLNHYYPPDHFTPKEAQDHYDRQRGELCDRADRISGITSLLGMMILREDITFSEITLAVLFFLRMNNHYNHKYDLDKDIERLTEILENP